MDVRTFGFKVVLKLSAPFFHPKKEMQLIWSALILTDVSFSSFSRDFSSLSRESSSLERSSLSNSGSSSRNSSLIWFSTRSNFQTTRWNNSYSFNISNFIDKLRVKRANWRAGCSQECFTVQACLKKKGRSIKLQSKLTEVSFLSSSKDSSSLSKDDSSLDNSSLSKAATFCRNLSFLPTI